MDADHDSRLKYRIEEVKCFTVLSQPLETSCEDLFYIGNNDLRNGSLIFRNKKASQDNMNLKEIKSLIETKTNTLATVYFNVSVEDLNHVLEPKATSLLDSKHINFKIFNLAMLVLTFSRQENTTLNKRNEVRLNDYHFVGSENEILLSDNLPINFQVYTVFLPAFPIIKKNGIKYNSMKNSIEYSLANENKYFMIDTKNGIYFLKTMLYKRNIFLGLISTITPLKGLTNETIEVLAKNSNGAILDKMILTFKIRNSSNLIIDFPQKIYKFEIFLNEASEVFEIGTVEAKQEAKVSLKYELMSFSKEKESIKKDQILENFLIDSQVDTVLLFN